jgi:hypothetical protein
MRIETTDDESKPNVPSAALQAAIAGTVVAGAFLLMPPSATTGGPFAGWQIAAITLGIAAATSSDAEDCIVPVIAGGLLLAFAREPSGIAALLVTLEAGAIAALIAGSGWLLLLSRRTAGEEHRVSTMGSALLLGGAADYLSMSALLFGLTAGGCWRLANSAVREHIRRDIAYVAHSLLALVLVMAGAHAVFSIPLFAIAIGYTVLRVCGKLTGSWIADRLSPGSPRPTTQLLMMPGAFGVAFALNVVRAMGTGFEPVLTVVVIGTVVSAFIAALSRPEIEA